MQNYIIPLNFATILHSEIYYLIIFHRKASVRYLISLVSDVGFQVLKVGLGSYVPTGFLLSVRYVAVRV